MVRDHRVRGGIFHGWKMAGTLSVVLFFGAAGLRVGRCFGELQFSKITGLLMSGVCRTS